GLAASAAEGNTEHTAEPAAFTYTPVSTSRARVETFLRHFLAQELHLTSDQVRFHQDLRDYGADSITAIRLMRAVARDFHIHMSGRDLLEHHTLHALTTYLAARLDEPVPPAAPDTLQQFKQGILSLEDMETLIAQGKVV